MNAKGWFDAYESRFVPNDDSKSMRESVSKKYEITYFKKRKKPILLQKCILIPCRFSHIERKMKETIAIKSCQYFYKHLLRINKI